MAGLSALLLAVMMVGCGKQSASSSPGSGGAGAGGGKKPICEYEQDVERLIADIRARSIPAAEFIPIRNTPEVLARYVRAMRTAGLFVTAGTEHNTLDLLPILPTCLGGVPIPDDLHGIFWEGACVVAAHQILTMRGEPGFVDAVGRPNPAYATPDARIVAFREIGEQIVAEYPRAGAARGA